MQNSKMLSASYLQVHEPLMKYFLRAEFIAHVVSLLMAPQDLPGLQARAGPETLH